MTRNEKKRLRVELRGLQALNGLTRVQAARMEELERIFAKPAPKPEHRQEGTKRPYENRSPWMVMCTGTANLFTGEID